MATQVDGDYRQLFPARIGLPRMVCLTFQLVASLVDLRSEFHIHRPGPCRTVFQRWIASDDTAGVCCIPGKILSGWPAMKNLLVPLSMLAAGTAVGWFSHSLLSRSSLSRHPD